VSTPAVGGLPAEDGSDDMPSITTLLGSAASRVGIFLLELLGFIIVLAIGWLVARLVQRGLAAGLRRVRFNDLVERGGFKAAIERTQYDASGIIGRAGFWVVLLIAVTYAFTVFGPNPISTVLTQVIGYIPRVLAALAIVLIGAALAAFVRDVVHAAIGELSYGKAVAAFSGGAVIYVATFMALEELAIAPAIVTGLFYASLAAIAGTIIVAAGGGGIPIMQRWWERASGQVELAAPQMAQQARSSSERIRGRGEEPAATEQPKEERPPVPAHAEPTMRPKRRNNHSGNGNERH
jgi:hypothetical protein